MSAISLKSITGITSITTPTGVDNQLTLHNNNTTEAVKLDTAGNLHFHNHLNITGISTAANFKTGTSNLHNTGLNVQDLDVDGHTNLDNVSIAGVTTFAGNVNSSGNITISNATPTLTFTDTDANPDFQIKANTGHFYFVDATNNQTRFYVAPDGATNFEANLFANKDFSVDGHTNLDNVSVAGVTTFTGRIDASDNIAITSGNRLYFGNSDTAFIKGEHGASANLVFGANNEKMRLTRTGRLGIGTADPQVMHHLYSASGGLYTRFESANEQVNFGNSNGAGIIQVTSTSQPLRILVNGTNERLRIDSNGDIGINVTNPTEKLHVSGNIKVTAQIFQSMPADYWSQGNTFIELNGMGNLTHMGSYETCLTSNGYRNSSTQWTSYAINSYTGASQIRLNPQGYISFGTEANKANGSTHVVTERLRINSSGFIGMGGNTNPTNVLHIKTAVTNTAVATIESTATNSYPFLRLKNDAREYQLTCHGGLSDAFTIYDGTSSAHRLTIASDGKVGINQNTPTCQLQIDSGSSGAGTVTHLELNHKGNDTNDAVKLNFARAGSDIGSIVLEKVASNNTTDFIINTRSYNTVSESMRITGGGKVGVGDNNPVVQFHVKGSGNSHATLNVHTVIEDTTSYAQNVGGLQVFEGAYDSSNNPAAFSAIHGGKENATDGNYAGYLRFLTRAHGAMPVEVARIASNGFMGVKTPDPQTELNVIGTVSTGRNVARELGTIINISSNHSGSRSGGNVINGVKEYEVGADWLAAGSQRVNANLTIELPQAYTCDRFVIYNQNEYSHSNREVKNFTLEGSNDNSSWTTILDDDCGCSHGHEPNPGFSFRLPSGFNDDEEGVTYRYWRFTMKTFHGSESYGGIMELELYQQHQSQYGRSEITTHSLVASDVNTQTLNGVERLTSSQGFNMLMGEDASDTWELTEQNTTTSGSFVDRSTIRHKRGVMSVSSVYNTGDLNIRIDNLYNLPGNAWWTFGLWIMTNQVVGTLAGHHSYMIHVVMTGLGSWSSMSASNIQGSGAGNVSVVAHGTNYVELKVDVNDSSRGPCTVLCNGGTFDPPRISFH